MVEENEATETRTGPYIQTYTGRRFYTLNPHPDDVDLADIAHSLALTARFNGHTKYFYSVAEHSVILSHLVAPQNALWALLHDAAEAYLGDLVWPLRQNMNIWRPDSTGDDEPVTVQQVEERLLRAIAWAFKLSWPIDDEIIQSDHQILVDEKKQVFNDQISWGEQLRGIQPLGAILKFWGPDEAERQFMTRWKEIQSLMQDVIHARGCTICPGCDQPYRIHPFEPHMLSGIDNEPYLRVACDGRRLKL